MRRQLVILAGGKGTRVQERLGDLPKPMIAIGGKPLLEHQLELARRHGFREILILAAHRAEAITAYFGDGHRWGIEVATRVETVPLGTAGAVLGAFPLLAERFVVMYGDTMLNVDLDRFAEAHRQSGADATLFLHPNDHPLDSDLVEADADGWIQAFHSRPHPPGACYQNLVNAALYAIEKSALEAWVVPERASDFGKDLFPAMLQRGQRLLGYRSPEYIKDIGAPDRHDRICEEYSAGVVQRSSWGTPQPAVFLDRDGTLNIEIDGVTAPDQVRLLAGVPAAVRDLNRCGYRAVVVTNQPVVAKGRCTAVDVQQVHNRLEMLLGQEGAYLDRIYYCPHHPEAGFPGERAELKIQCACRKPGIGMIERATQELAIDRSRSWLIGDSPRDIQTAANAGLKSILLRTGSGGSDQRYPAVPDFIFDTLARAVQFILQQQTA